jgi:hypothetical protein
LKITFFNLKTLKLTPNQDEFSKKNKTLNFMVSLYIIENLAF